MKKLNQRACKCLRRGQQFAATLTVVCGAMCGMPTAATGQTSAGSELKPFSQDVPAAAFKFDMIPIKGDAAIGIKPFYIGKTELTWEAFDVFIYSLDAGGSKDGGAPTGPERTVDEKASDSKDNSKNNVKDKPADAVSRPSKPYLPPDRGFGHEGFAAICVSAKNAQEFCKWMSQKSGRHYRLPTQAEWEYACHAGTTGPYSFGKDTSKAGEYAWFEANADSQAHAVASKKPNPWGLYDMHGNVAEWVIAADGTAVTMGGSYHDALDKLAADKTQKSQPSWNASDPQIPKSKWWLADGPFVGFRVVCDVPGSPDASPVVESTNKDGSKPSGKPDVERVPPAAPKFP